MSIVRIKLSFPSVALLRPVPVEIALPGPLSAASRPYRALWLLHCALEDGNFFFESLNAGKLAEKYHLALIAPSLDNGYFINTPNNRQADVLAELKASLPDILPISPDRKDNSVLGISMGAFGALRWALESGSFGSVACISGVFDCFIAPDPRIQKNRPLRTLHMALEKHMRACLLDGQGQTRAEANFDLLGCGYAGERPQLHFYCGEEDYLSLTQTASLQKRLAKTGFNGRLVLAPGSHDPDFWRFGLHDAASAIYETPQAE